MTGSSPVDPIADHLRNSNDVIRCAAIRAYAVNAAEADARAALIEALSDPDPDVRTDAIERLIDLARPEDAEILKASLQGDPVREVKMAAILGLTRFEDAQSIPLFRALVHSRADDMIVWEDEGGDWDDWLDVQIAAIRALGEMGETDAINDLLAARQDEFGQDIDDAVFEALRKFGAQGTQALYSTFQAETGISSRRALSALAASDRVALQALIPELLQSEDPHVRAIALSTLQPSDPRLIDMARKDPAARIRCEALRRLPSTDRAEIEAALKDKEEEVQAQALSLLGGTVSPETHNTLVDNLFLWLRHARPTLACAAADALPKFAPNRCEAPLLDAAKDHDLHLSVRVAALQALIVKTPPMPTAMYADLLTNPARQIRAAALAALGARAEANDSEAAQLLISSILGEVNTASSIDDLGQTEDSDHATDAAIPKGEGGAQHIQITRDGDIVEGDVAPEGSTLQQILSDSVEPPATAALAEDTPEEIPAKRRRRQPVEGPENFAHQFQLDAIAVSANASNTALETALLTVVRQSSEDIRRAAWLALSKWPQDYDHAKPVREAALVAVQDPDPVIRTAAFELLSKQDLPADTLRQALESDDGLFRAAAIRHLPPETVIDFLSDPAPTVRSTALERVIADGNSDLHTKATMILVNAEQPGILGELFAQSEQARKAGLVLLEGQKTPKRVLVLLEALAAHQRSDEHAGEWA